MRTWLSFALGAGSVRNVTGVWVAGGQTAWQTELGQLLDMSTESPETGKMDFSRFSLERYKLIVKYKTAFYSFYLPVASGLILAGVHAAPRCSRRAAPLEIASATLAAISDGKQMLWADKGHGVKLAVMAGGAGWSTVQDR